jgi:hypothetical protein
LRLAGPEPYHAILIPRINLSDSRVGIHCPNRQSDVLAILDRIVRRIARPLADEARDDSHVDTAPDVLAQVQAEAAVTWRSPQDVKPTVRGVASQCTAYCAGGIPVCYRGCCSCAS